MSHAGQRWSQLPVALLPTEVGSCPWSPRLVSGLCGCERWAHRSFLWLPSKPCLERAPRLSWKEGDRGPLTPGHSTWHPHSCHVPRPECPPFPHAGDGDGAEVKMKWLLSKGLQVPRRRGGSGSGRSPAEGGFWARRPGKSVGGSRPPPSCWDGACAALLVRGQPAWNAALPVALPPTSAQGIWPTPGFY